MASTYVNDLRLNELGTGDASGTWGTITNLNLELIGEGLSYATQDCFTTDADATTTVADGASDPARAMYFKVTSSATLTATRTLTIAPNTVSRLQFIENATTGSQSINISQGSGGNVTIPTGATKAVYLDGGGATAAVTDAFADLNVRALDATTLQIGGTSITATATELNYNDISTLGQVQASKTVTADSSSQVNFLDNAKIRLGTGNDLQLFHDGSNSYITETGTGDLRLRATNLVIQSATEESLANFTADGAVTLYYDNSAKIATKSDGVDITGELQCDTLDVDGNADISGTLTMGGNINLQDNDFLYLGTGQDLILYHDGNNSYVADNGTGNLFIRGTNLVLEDSAGNDYIVCTDNGTGGTVELKHNSSTKLTTTTDGVSVTGSLYASSNIGLDSNDHIAFANNSYMNVWINGNNEFRFEADGDFHADADVIAFSTTVSDERLKTDIEKIENATDKVSQLNGYTFTYKADGKKSAGVIAQEVEKVLPSAVSEKELPLKTDDGVAYKTVQYDQIIGLLIESIKELKQEINDLKGV